MACAIVSPVMAAATVCALCIKKSRRIGLRSTKYSVIAVTTAVAAVVALNAVLGNGDSVPSTPLVLLAGASFTVGTVVAAVRSWVEIRRMRAAAR
jgi:undecaprenyl pyrophosphate phosphatase UppP